MHLILLLTLVTSSLCLNLRYKIECLPRGKRITSMQRILAEMELRNPTRNNLPHTAEQMESIQPHVQRNREKHVGKNCDRQWP